MTTSSGVIVIEIIFPNSTILFSGAFSLLTVNTGFEKIILNDWKTATGKARVIRNTVPRTGPGRISLADTYCTRTDTSKPDTTEARVNLPKKVIHRKNEITKII